MRNGRDIDAASGATPAFEQGSDLAADQKPAGSAAGGEASGAAVPCAADKGDASGPADAAAGGAAEAPFPSNDVQDLIDAVAGATWGTRNRIMEERFLSALEKGSQGVPAYKPPGETLESD